MRSYTCGNSRTEWSLDCRTSHQSKLFDDNDNIVFKWSSCRYNRVLLHGPKTSSSSNATTKENADKSLSGQMDICNNGCLFLNWELSKHCRLLTFIVIRWTKVWVTTPDRCDAWTQSQQLLECNGWLKQLSRDPNIYETRVLFGPSSILALREPEGAEAHKCGQPKRLVINWLID